MKTKYSTEDYEETHGRKPNTRELAGWSFWLFREHAGTKVIVPRPMSYAEAKRFALSEAKAIGGIVEIHVCP